MSKRKLTKLRLKRFVLRVAITPIENVKQFILKPLKNVITVVMKLIV